jgi:hypothetical protein
LDISWISCWVLQYGPRPIKYLLCFVLHKTQLLYMSSRCMNQSVVRSRYKGNKCTDCIIKPSNAFSIFLWIIHDRANKKEQCMCTVVICSPDFLLLFSLNVLIVYIFSILSLYLYILIIIYLMRVIKFFVATI